MKPLSVGAHDVFRIETAYAHTAAALGNVGVTVVSTPSLIGFLEMAAHHCLLPYCEAGEGSVGTMVNVRHLAAAPEGALVVAEATVTAVKGRLVEFAVHAAWNGTLLMEGSHGRAVVHLGRFFEKLGLKLPA